ncbi:MAG TPA: thioredoxin domain-containing protein [Gammaproteobacteria bacterium]|nr:thioredoxin domain-containing protein [Gammaproteobacteria bacterium]
MNEFKNRLIHETSPYLKQHAHNPVDWYPWGEDALAKARETDKPILLSIGYSACHWCHVMAHESFEDPATAKVMNDLFVNIKVDREERPDVDKIYQTSQLLLNQRGGGWPLTMFLTPADQVPFFGGTYFPKEPRYGLPAFTDLLKRVAAFYREKRAEIDNQNSSMLTALHSIYAQPASDAPPDPAMLDMARNQLEQSFDARYGGFGRAPKFPHPTNIECLLRRWAATQRQGEPDQRALHMAIFTLDKMALGGIYDHLGGGFCRYSVDDQWMIPHFEKMLYDNGPLLAITTQAAVAIGSKLLARTAHETAGWVMREMQAPEGGYYSSLDADSEGEEGKFYVWRRQEVEALLEPRDYAIFARRFGLARTPNFEGHWHLHTFAELDALAAEFNTDEQAILVSLDRSRAKLFQAREHRVRPGRDEKILTSWNALMIKGMVVAGRHLNKPAYIESATSALDFIRTTLWRGGRLLATYKDGKAHLNAYLDDYAFLIDAILELLQARWRSHELHFACELADVLLTHFEDKEQGGFYFTADDHEQLIQRPKTLGDEATPSGNGIAAQVLARLGYILGETRYLDATERTLKFAARMIGEAPVAHASLLTALEEIITAPQIVILRGAREKLDEWHRLCIRDYAPGRLSFAIPNDARDLPDALAAKSPQDETVAYICEGMTCSPPISEQKRLEALLANTKTTQM